MKYFLSAALICLVITVKAQNITKQQIDGWLIKCDTAYKPGKVSGYAFNKTMYEPKDSVKLNSDLALIKSADLLTVDPFWNEELISTTNNAGKFTVLILKKGEQNAAIKQSTLKIALSKYKKTQSGKIGIASAEPVLVINGQPVTQADCLEKLSAVKAETITDIYYSKHPVPQELYGPNAKNGIVTVWTK
ncbi:hypothetical protein [Mucilaginibacter sp.]|uniref:hypothetical protein n=1 Tax=Mucilaginibacter sp. TaxID=1882438 RepID=UPI000CB3CBC5|nr:hypothetical protein [Mucilaginibacter sp.]PLW88616.1 MAG: hypothetical protein C0154_15775 [Mucilaginibacter sp.]HEK19451.1 hypothetical protein [Bacteroidota bacterium]